MAISKAEKAAYNDYVKEYKNEIDIVQKKIKDIEINKKKMPNIANYYNFEIVLELIKSILLYIDMSEASLEMLHIKNEGYLNNARKEIYNILRLMEEIVGNDIDRQLKENEEHLEKISNIDPPKILSIIQSIRKVNSLLIEKFGEGSKWKWSFVDVQGRIAVISKNFVNFSDIQKYRDPRSEFYQERQELLKLCKESLNTAAKEYKHRYEVSTKVPGDIIKSIELLSVLRKINILFGESNEANKLKNTIEALKARMESEEKKKEKKKKKEK
ncbi:MAG: hypothetical protein SVR08_09590 [Spirochaetota bacterium]|nr:hypothetical protein [Spirochaetota bacterium]